MDKTSLPIAENTTSNKLDWRDPTLIKEEYHLLSRHYFHEDIFFLRTVGLFGTLNVALLTVYGSSIVGPNQTFTRLSILLVALCSTIAWGITLIRIRYLRRKIEFRIAELERGIVEYWRREGDEPPFAFFQIRNRIETANWVQSIPVSRIMLLFPASFAMIWTTFLVAIVFDLPLQNPLPPETAPVFYVP